MSTPKVTVLMPVYNGERYLHEAIRSILDQTFTDFELLIIDDGSTDKSADIIKSFSDKRILLIQNGQNIGLIKTLNKGIELAQGEYIARMDCDDISLPQRLEKQVNFLNSHPETSVVACHIAQINSEGKESGLWEDEKNTTDFAEIRSMLAKTNCIAHPSVMIRKSIAQKYNYSEKQKGSEDWDLWMRLVADGKRIEKVNEVLVKYRMHPLSATQAGNSGKKSQKKVIKVKQVFLNSQLSSFKINSFFFAVLYSWVRSVTRYAKLYSFPELPRSTKRILTLNPFKVFSDYSKLKSYLATHNHTLLFFFPYTHVGGAEQVHADIVECVKDLNPLVFFTGFSKNQAFLPLFDKNAQTFNIPNVLNHPFTRKKVLKLLINYINSQPQAKTFGCNSMFYNDMITELSPSVYCIDLKHSFIYPGNPEEYNSLPSIFRLNKRVFISKAAIEKAKQFYADNNIPNEYSERIVHIANYTQVPERYAEKAQNEKLKVIYVGRATPEKRVHIVMKIAEECHKQNLRVKFQIVGNVSEAIDTAKYPFVEFSGEVTDKNALQNIYNLSDILLITSNTEGFPMSIMEAMANGVIPISTPVGDVPIHVINNETGFVTSSIDEPIVVNEIVEKIKQLSANRELTASLSHKAYDHAKTNFQYSTFRDSYRKLFNA